MPVDSGSKRKFLQPAARDRKRRTTFVQIQKNNNECIWTAYFEGKKYSFLRRVYSGASAIEGGVERSDEWVKFKYSMEGCNGMGGRERGGERRFRYFDVIITVAADIHAAPTEFTHPGVYVGEEAAG